MHREHHYYVYIMQSASRRALYIGMTNNLHKRVWQHKNHLFEGFTDDYNAVRLVYWESFDDVRNAIDREKQLKKLASREETMADCEIEPRMERPGSRVVPNTRSLDCARDDKAVEDERQ